MNGREFMLGEFRVRPLLSRIDGPGGSRKVEPRSMEVLVELAHGAGEVRGRQELIDSVWAGAFVSDEVLSHCVWDLRQALEDTPRSPRFIQTVPRRGYRLIGPVSWLDGGVGETSGRYRLGEKIGGGGMGEVWRAEDTRLRRTVALKFLPAEWSRDPDAKRRLLREARAAAALDHPNICAVYDVDETEDGRLFLVMPAYSGRTLRTRLAEGPLDWREAVAIAEMIAAALGAAHAQGIVHRDLKPSNVLLTDDSEVKLLDFGLAEHADATRVTRSASSPGTPAYMAPEQITADEASPRTDLWALGAVLYELLAGSKAFTGQGDQAVIYSILHSQPLELPAEVPAPVRALVARALSKSPAQRFQSAEEVLGVLRTLLGRRRSDAAQGGSGGRGKRALVPWAAAAALLALGIAGVLVVTTAPWARTPPLRIAVAPPEADLDPALELAALGIQSAVLDALAEVPGVSAVEAAPRPAMTPDGVAALTRPLAADELLESAVRGPVGGLCQVTLQRVDGTDGGVLWSDAFESICEPAADLRPLYDVVRLRLLRSLGDRADAASSRSDVPLRMVVTEADYTHYLRLRREVETDAVPDLALALDELDQMLESSPAFLGTLLLAADIARSLYSSSRGDSYLERGAAYLERATELAPGDVRPWIARFQLSLAAGRGREAAAALDAIAADAPAHYQLPVLRSRLAEREGDLDQARRLMLAAVDRYPSWQRLLRLANLEAQIGDVDSARRHLELLLERSPGNTWGLGELAELEMIYGDVERAESLYAELTRRPRPRVGDLINLGLSRSLLGRRRGAVEVLEAALEDYPDNPGVLLNLADAQLALGEVEAARAGYRRVLERSPSEPTPVDLMVQAQCRLHLGEVREAVRLTQDALARAPESSEVLYLAALVYAVAGDRTSALVNAERSLAKGVQTIWFLLPQFDSLRDDPAFRELLAGTP